MRAAEVTYGHISAWKTGGVTDMYEMMDKAIRSALVLQLRSFNEDIGALSATSRAAAALAPPRAFSTCTRPRPSTRTSARGTPPA